MRLSTSTGLTRWASLVVRASRTKRITCSYKFATELVGTNNYTATDVNSLKPFFDNLGAPLGDASRYSLRQDDPAHWRRT